MYNLNTGYSIREVTLTIYLTPYLIIGLRIIRNVSQILAVSYIMKVV